MQSEVEGIVLKETLYSETSKVIQLLTDKYGLISVIAKGSVSPKSQLRSLTLPFLYGKFNIIYKENKLSILKSGSIIKLFGSNSNDIKLFAYMSYICDLSYNVLKENNNKEIFNIVKNSLEKLCDGLNYEVIKNIVEFKFFDYLGIKPNLDVCQKCFKKTNFVAIDGKIGGFICSECYHNERKVPDNFSKILKRYSDVNISEIKEIKITKENQEIVNEFIKEYYESFSAVYLNSKKFMDAIIAS